MADCYYHGSSGSGGPCSKCEREEREDLGKGSVAGFEPIPMQIRDDFQKKYRYGESNKQTKDM